MTTAPRNAIPRREGRRDHHHRALPDPADDVRRLRRRPRQLVLPQQLPPEVGRRRRPGRHRVDAQPHQVDQRRVRQPQGERHRRHRRAPADCAGAGGTFEVTVDRGTTATALRVIVTDPNATRYFSQVISNGEQRLTRQAEAEYNLPIPLGSPLNYFGGDSTRTVPATPPTPTRSTGRPTPTARPGRRRAQVGDTAQTFGCNVGTAAGPGLRSLDAAPRPTGHAASAATHALQLQRHLHRSPAARPRRPAARLHHAGRPRTRRATCSRRTARPPNGRWADRDHRFNADRPLHEHGTGQPPVHLGQSRPPRDVPNFANGTNIPPGSAPVNRPCRVGYETTPRLVGPDRHERLQRHRRVSGGTAAARQPAVPVAGRHHHDHVTHAAQPDLVDPLAGLLGPGRGSGHRTPPTATPTPRAATPSANCSSVQNQQYKPPTDPDRGYWYVVKVPAATVGSIDINVFDASHNTNGSHRPPSPVTGRSPATRRSRPTSRCTSRPTRSTSASAPRSFPSTTGNEVDGSCNWRVNGGRQHRLHGPVAPPLHDHLAHPGRHLPHQRPVGGHHRRRRERLRPRGRHRREPRQPQPARPVRLRQHGHVQQQPLQPHAAAPRRRPRSTWPRSAPSSPAARSSSTSGTRATSPPATPACTPRCPPPRRPSRCETCRPTTAPTRRRRRPNPVQSGGDPTGAVVLDPAGVRQRRPLRHHHRHQRHPALQRHLGDDPDRHPGRLHLRGQHPVARRSTPRPPPTPAGGASSTSSRQSSQDVTTWQARIEGNPVHLTQLARFSSR